jgi:hypothetical protein
MAIFDTVAANTSGVDYTVPLNSVGSGVKNIGGAATKIANTDLLDGVAVSGSEMLDEPAVRGVGKRLETSNVAAVNSYLKSGAAVPSVVRSIHKLEVLRTLRVTSAIRANEFDEFSGTFSAGYPVNAVDSLDTDVAATPTRAVPGKLTFQFGSNLPVNESYKSKTG